MSTTAAIVESEHELKHRTSIPEKPITEEREPLVPAYDDEKNGVLSNYAVPRANVAATREAPNGTEKDQYNYGNRKKTVGSSISTFAVCRGHANSVPNRF